MSVVQLHQPRRRVRLPRSIKIFLGATVFALIFLGQGIALYRAAESGATAPLPIPRTGSLQHRMSVALRSALGPSDRHVARFHIDSIRTAPGTSGRKIVTVTWAINNDLTWGTLGNGAQVDAYIILRALYDSGFPVARVNLTGTYTTHTHHESVVMRLAMPRRVDRLLKQAGGWNEYDAGSVWPLIHRI